MVAKAAVWRYLKDNAFYPSKKMGQNFLVDAGVADAICAAAKKIVPGAAILEIGPGLGALSERLAKLGAPRYAAIEIDKRLAASLLERGVLPEAALTVGDALDADWDAMFAQTPGACLVGNLPYSLSSPLLGKFVRSENFAGAVLMLQLETAQRVCAATGSGDYNAFSAWVRTFCSSETLFKVDRSCFVPKPGVESAVVAFKKRGADADPERLRDFLQKCFAQRRKTLANNLKPFYRGCAVVEALVALGFEPTARAQQLEPAELVALDRALNG